MNPQPPLELVISGINTGNYRHKMMKAIRTVSEYLGVPMTARKMEHAHEPYFYAIQQELSDQWTGYYQGMLRRIYGTVIEALGLPPVEVETMRKALGDSGILKYRGRIIYNPETGEPLKNKDFDNLIEAIQKYLNRNTKELSKQILLDSMAIGKLLRRMAKYQSSAEMNRLKLDGLKYRGRTFDWIRQDIKNLNSVLGQPLSGPEMARYQAAQDYVAHLVTRSNQKIRDDIKDTVLRGIIEKRTKAQVSQDLFNRLGGLNRDWKRIADTEIVNTSNLAGILQEVNDAPKGERVYFKRYELPGCCSKCAKVNGVIALWSNTPLADDKIKDPYASVAIWEGKPQEKGRTVLVTGTLHPNCRGGWLRWGGKQADAMTAQVRGKAGKWDAAIEQAREEYRKQGTENPNDQTPGYIDRINELYRKKLGEEE
ncbi:MAG: hypothetical protein LBH73_00785 [Spirochaetaceae bacterium]|jgi:hypothetical protein|nr:hypothetical protein [Spirochaetaceae bacterium]